MAFKQINTQDQDLRLIQDNIIAALSAQSTLIKITIKPDGTKVANRSQINPPFVGGTLISLALVSGQDNLISHGLNRLPEVWSVARLDANAVIWEQATSLLKDANGIAQSATDQFINLRCSANCTATVWVN